jgi:leucyl aminopeptidase
MPLTLDPSCLVFVTAEPANSVGQSSETSATDRPLRSGDADLAGVAENFLTASGFKAEAGQTALLPQAGPVAIAVGLGDEPLTQSILRNAAASVAKAAAKLDSLTTALAVSGAEDLGADVATQAVVEGILLASYRYDELKGKPEDPQALAAVVIVVPDGTDTDSALSKAVAVAEGVALARDLVNKPGGTLNAEGLAAAAQAVADQTGLGIEIWDRERLTKERCGGILGVNAGSTAEPRLVRLTYTPAGESSGVVHLVGKGITFDTGGLNLKPYEGMMTMKIDMGGAAAVLGAMRAVAAGNPSVTVVGTICCTDNQPGPNATMPGDVLQIRNGKTVEVLNTDAEGRLVLADGLSLAVEDEPDLIIDLATLTGACMVALGNDYAGLMGNNDAAIARVGGAAAAAGELMWHLPLPKEYRKQLDSDVADLRNIGSGRMGGALTAGLFLKEFAGETPWVHLDIAGPVTTESASGDQAKGATGYGVRTLLEVIASFS